MAGVPNVHVTPLQVGNNGAGVSVTVNSCSPTAQSLSVTPQVSVPRRGVTITPIHSSQPKPTIIGKVLLKAVSKKQTGKKVQSGAKTFVLRSINTSTVSTCSLLKALIRKQVGGEIIKDDFDVGYLQGNNVITMRNKEDIMELWSNLIRGSNTVIWCDGLLVQQSKGNRKRPSVDSESDDEEHPIKKTKKDERDSAVKKYIEDLNAAHKEKYTPMQYRIWAEMKSGGLHDSMTTPPATSMFMRAGGTTPKKTAGANDTVSQAICQLASALTPKVPSSSATVASRVGDSPAKVIENRSKCYRQLAELKNLMESGLLSEEEYTSERQAVMDTLHKLKGK